MISGIAKFVVVSGLLGWPIGVEVAGEVGEEYTVVLLVR